MLMVPIKCKWCPCVKCDTRYSESGWNKFAVVEYVRKVAGVCVSYSIKIIRVPWETVISGSPVVFCVFGEVYILQSALYEYLDDAVHALAVSNKPAPRSSLPLTRWGEPVCGAWGGDVEDLTMEDPVIGWYYSEIFPVTQEWLCDSCTN